MSEQMGCPGGGANCRHDCNGYWPDTLGGGIAAVLFPLGRYGERLDIHNYR